MKEALQKLQIKAYVSANNFINGERGDSNMVSIAMVIVIVIAVAAIFRTALTEMVQTIAQRIKDFVGS